MATKVTIEGSRITPSDKLAAGERRTVLLTAGVQTLIDRGYAILISSEELPPAAPVDAPAPEPEAPQDETSELEPDPEPEVAEDAPKRRRRNTPADE